ncbi:MAG: hypothetical protein LBR78_00675, partial [Holosporales bacterium]|nr:hypothetical protein [Holosporales bacterium]
GVVERGVGRGCYVEEMQRVVVRQRGEIDGLRELVGRYERLSRRLMRGLSRVDEREETLRMIRNMVDRNGGIHLLRDRVIERIYDTAWTINGVPIMGRTSGWRWYEAGTDWTYGGHRVVMMVAYATTIDSPMRWRAIATTDESSPGVNIYDMPHTHDSYHFYYTEVPLPTLPAHQRAEVVIITCYGHDNNFLPGYSIVSKAGGGIEAFKIHSRQIVWFEPPVAEKVKMVKEDNDPYDMLGMPRSMQ